MTSVHSIFCSVRSCCRNFLCCLQDHKAEKVIVYLLTCACVDFFEAALLQVPELKSVQLHALHGRMKQAVRETTLQKYTTQPAGTACCTLAALFLKGCRSPQLCVHNSLVWQQHSRQRRSWFLQAQQLQDSLKHQRAKKVLTALMSNKLESQSACWSHVCRPKPEFTTVTLRQYIECILRCLVLAACCALMWHVCRASSEYEIVSL